MRLGDWAVGAGWLILTERPAPLGGRNGLILDCAHWARQRIASDNKDYRNLALTQMEC